MTNPNALRARARDLLLDNPMALEAARARRRFLRTGGDTGRGVNAAIGIICGALYLWLLAGILRYNEDLTLPILLVELGLVTLVAPLSMYAAVSGEREKLTWDALILTRLSPAQVVAGKLLWRTLLVLGIVALAVPPLLLCHYGLGLWATPGTTGYNSAHRGPDYLLRDVAWAQGLIVAWGVLLQAFALWVSARTKRAITTLSVVTLSVLGYLVLPGTLLALFAPNYEFHYLRRSHSSMHRVGALLVDVNPFLEVPSLSIEGQRYASNHMHHDCRFQQCDPEGVTQTWQRRTLSRLLPGLYLGLAGLFLCGAWRALRGLEMPIPDGRGGGRGGKP